MIKFDNTQLQQNLQSLRDREAEVLVERAAQIKGMNYINLRPVIISTDALGLIPERVARDAGIACYRRNGQSVDAAVLSPDTPKIRAILQDLTDEEFEVTLYLASQRSLEKAWGRYADISSTNATAGSFLDISDKALQDIAAAVKTNKDVGPLLQSILEGEDEKKTSAIVDLIMGSAIATKSSDIHIEPQDEVVRLRYRQDGILEDVAAIPHKAYKSVNSRLKILSGLKISTTGDAQDGRFTIDYQNKEIEIRVSTIPGPYGEGIVMRILDPDGINVGLEQLGIEPYLLSILQREIEKPNGLILNSGPTGSGKTTTLYSLLKYLYKPSIKILTIEDPIEYHLNGIHQTQVNHSKGYDFESGLRAAMRQDPDAILVGEIRDHETALAAMQASQTGHMVISTIHTNDAAGVLPRLLDLDINSATVAQAMTIALAQRLVRRLTDSKKKEKPTEHQERVLRAILKRAEQNGKDLSRFNVSSDMPEIFVHKPVPSEFSESGYKGRIGIFEAILVDDEIASLLEKKPSDREIYKASQKQNILTLAEDAAVKIITGQTSYEECMRVVDLEEHIDLSTEAPEEEISEQVTPTMQQNSIPSVNTSMPFYEQPHVRHTIGSSNSELHHLIDYLRILEDHQRNNPTIGIAQKIEEVQDSITSILTQTHHKDLFVQPSNEQRLEHEIESVIGELESLRAHQRITPEESIANQIRDLRMNIERLKQKRPVY